MKTVCVVLVLFIMTGQAWAQEETKPKLVVGIVVDQMRYEYLERFYPKYGEDGFRKLMGEGFSFRNMHFNYVPTYTGPGHASVYTGTTPAIHGVIGNDWYDKVTRKMVNCVEDARYKPVGSEQGNGDVSPSRMLTTTITDELKLVTQMRSKVISVSIKDRGAVLPGGHMADGVYWYDDKTGNFITSTYYATSLPSWVDQFNKQGLPDKYLSQTWKTVYPIDQYTESGADDSPYEALLKGKSKPVFPYNLKEMRGNDKGYSLLSKTPFSNDYLTQFALSALEHEKLGQRGWTDFLAISYSTPDILGHDVGPYAIELEDMYIRLDKNIAELLKRLDDTVGKNNYVLFLTADHAVADNAQQLIDHKVPAGFVSDSELIKNLNEYLAKYFSNTNIIENVSNHQIFFNDEAFQTNPRTAGVDMIIASELITKYLLTRDGVANVYAESVLRQSRYDEAGLKGLVIRGYHPKRSGDVVIVTEPGWVAMSKPTGTTHGSPFTYDTHVPGLFYGHGIKKGSSVRYHAVTDIAPTLSMLLKIKLPNGCTGQPMEELFLN